MAVAPRGFGVRDVFGFPMFGQGCDPLLNLTGFESLLLGAPPLIWLGRSATRRGGSQVFADVKEVAQKVPWVTKPLPTRRANPIGDLADGGDAAVYSPSLPAACNAPNAVRFPSRYQRSHHTPW